MQERLDKFLQENYLSLIRKISKGYSSEVFLVQNEKGEKFALKIEKGKSPRKNMVERETENLKLANSVSVGPKLFSFDEEKRIILMEFIEGKTFSEWLLKGNPPKKILEALLKKIFSQAKKLDEIGLDHGQLAGKGKNILVRKNSPVIIDFEKSSVNRKVHNVSQLEGFLYRNPHSAIAGKVREIIEG